MKPHTIIITGLLILLSWSLSAQTQDSINWYPLVHPDRIDKHQFSAVSIPWWLPVAGGLAGGGTITYFVLRDPGEEPESDLDPDPDPQEPEDCTFTTEVSATDPDCGFENGSIALSFSPTGNYSVSWDHGATGPQLNDVPAGTYTAIISRTGTTCSDTVSVTLEGQASYSITILKAVPPSSPSAADGLILATVLSTMFPPPFDVYLNGEFLYTANDFTFYLEGLPTGIYEIHAIHADSGCPSETVEVELSGPGIPNRPFSWGTGSTFFLPVSTATLEHPGESSLSFIRPPSLQAQMRWTPGTRYALEAGVSHYGRAELWQFQLAGSYSFIIRNRVRAYLGMGSQVSFQAGLPLKYWIPFAQGNVEVPLAGNAVIGLTIRKSKDFQAIGIQTFF